MLVYVCIAIPKRVLYAIKIINIITFIMYTQNRKNGKPYDLKVFASKKHKRPKCQSSLFSITIYHGTEKT